ncbi:MAG: hypothetical protein AAGA99_06645 [Actinomycetota bacterium]
MRGVEQIEQRQDPARAHRRRPDTLTGSLVILAVAILPFDGLRIILPLPELFDLTRHVLLLAIVASSVFGGAELRRQAPRGLMPPMIVAASALAALGALWFVLEPSRAAAVGFVAGYLPVLVAPAVWWCPPSRRQIDRLITVLMTVVLMTTAVGLLQQVVGPERLHSLGYEWNEHLRWSGGIFRTISTFNQPFPFAFFLATGLLVCVPVALAERSRRRSFVFLVSSPFVVAALLSTVVRASFLMVAAGFLVLIFLLREHRPALVVIPALVVAALVLASSPAFNSIDSGSTRLETWSETVPDALGSPWGSGLTEAGVAGQSEYLETVGSALGGIFDFSQGPRLERVQPDNQFVVTGATVGLLGVFAAVVALVATFTHGRRLAERDEANEVTVGLARGIAALVAGVAVAAMASTYFEIFPGSILLWLFVGLLPCLTSPSTPSR